MDPAVRALTAPNINDSTKNGGFLRDDASLSVVCVTDARTRPAAAGLLFEPAAEHQRRAVEPVYLQRVGALPPERAVELRLR